MVNMKTPTLTNDRDLSIQIADAIRNAIISGDLIFDARLPSETELSETFGVSRPTVREALKRLAAQNQIHRHRHLVQKPPRHQDRRKEPQPQGRSDQGADRACEHQEHQGGMSLCNCVFRRTRLNVKQLIV